jgi:hypothetical protein
MESVDKKIKLFEEIISLQKDTIRYLIADCNTCDNFGDITKCDMCRSGVNSLYKKKTP